jgi:low temperature requirement protein LtrA
MKRTPCPSRTSCRSWMSRTSWKDLTPRQKTAILVIGAVQLSLAATAWTDLATRPASRVNGRKGVWAAVIAVDFIGPILYFTRGRR